MREVDIYNNANGEFFLPIANTITNNRIYFNIKNIIYNSLANTLLEDTEYCIYFVIANKLMEYSK